MFLEAVAAAFVATQLCYFAVNCGLLRLFLRRPTTVVDERTLGRLLEAAGSEAAAPSRDAYHRPRARADGGRATPRQSSSRSASRSSRRTPPGDAGPKAARNRNPGVDDGPGPRCRLPERLRRRFHVFVPVTGARPDALERTLESLARGSYPAGLIAVYPVAASPDASSDSVSTSSELEGAIGAIRPPGLEVVALEADGADDGDGGDDGDGDGAAAGADLAWAFEGPALPPATAAAVADAYERRAEAIAADDVVTVLEAGSWVPVDAVELAVAGLAEYDVVRTKRTVFDVDRGMLPLLESMGAAVRSDLEPGSSAGPYHLPATGTFLEAGTLTALERWRREADASLPLGVAASRRGCALGVVDRYVETPCPARLEPWLREKRRWIRGLHRDLFGRGWAGVDDLHGRAGTLLLLSLAVVSLAGAPAAVLVAVLAGSGVDAVPFSRPLWLLAGFNAVVWGYCSLRAYRAARSAVAFRSGPHRAAYSILANPLSQAVYATLWAVPICLGLADALRGRD